MIGRKGREHANDAIRQSVPYLSHSIQSPSELPKVYMVTASSSSGLPCRRHSSGPGCKTILENLLIFPLLVRLYQEYYCSCSGCGRILLHLSHPESLKCFNASGLMSAPTSTRTRIGFLHAAAPKQSTVVTRLFAAARHGTLDSQRDTVELPLVKTLLCRITTHTRIPPLNCMQITAVQHTSTGSLCPTQARNKGMGVTIAGGSDVAPFPTTTELSHCLQTVVFLHSAAKCWCLEVTSCRHHSNPSKARTLLVF